jgi:histidine triad (HIT) family protein
MDCIFCKIANGEIPSKNVYEDENFLAFLDINPRNPGHTLVITKQHYDNFLNMPENAAAEYMKVINRLTRAVAVGIKAEGINVTNNNGAAAGSLVSHVHFHIIPRFKTDGSANMESLLKVKKLEEKEFTKILENIKKNIKTEIKEPEKPKEELVPEPQVQELETDVFSGHSEVFEEDDA